MKCLSCGHNNPDEANFCNNCGEKLLPAETAGKNNAVNDDVNKNQNTAEETGEAIDNDIENVALESGESYEYQEETSESSDEYDEVANEPEADDDNPVLKSGISVKIIAIAALLTAIIIAGVLSSVNVINKTNLSVKDVSTSISSVSSLSSTTQITTTEETVSETVTTSVTTTAKLKEEYIVNTKSDPLRMRKEPNTDSKIITSIPKGTILTVSETKNGWSKVTYKGKTGWVSNEFLKKVENNDNAGTQSDDNGKYSAIWYHNYFIDEFGDPTGEGFYSTYAYDVVCESIGRTYYNREVRVLVPESPYQNERYVLFEIKTNGRYDILYSEYDGLVKDAYGNKQIIKAYETDNEKYLMLSIGTTDRFYQALKTGKAEIYLYASSNGSETYRFKVDKGNLETKMSIDSLITTAPTYVYTTTVYTESETTTRNRIKIF